ncbi:MAG TPA: DUF2268 domain-containing putative Zn-dependent protease [Roseiflexaceae bacterium]|nr:DUF2268 domain-containing putative Zn-dependent protease [Roseiflexaceae bacterium]
MKFTIIDTDAIYRRLLVAADQEVRERIFREELVAPFEGMTAAFGGDGMAAFAQWGMRPDQFGPAEREYTLTTLNSLRGANAWERAAQSLQRGAAAFAEYGNLGPRQVVFALLAARMKRWPGQAGYTGFGGMPGWIMTVYDTPEQSELDRLEACTVHELHHNVRFSLFPFNPIATSVGEYLIAEGLAEAFAGELYGHDLIGPWVTNFDETRLDETRAQIGAALAETGFDTIRAYIFGDGIAAQTGMTPVGVPDFAGYAIGYRVVRAWQARTGKSVVEATLLPAGEIIDASGFFDA